MITMVEGKIIPFTTFKGGTRLIQFFQAMFIVDLLVMAVIFGWIIAGNMGETQQTADAAEQMPHDLLSGMNAALTCIILLLVMYLVPLLKNINIPKHPLKVDEDERVYWLRQFINMRFIRLVMLSGAGIFGILSCFLISEDGVLTERPVYWLNAIPMIIFMTYAVMTFPMQTKLNEAYTAGQGTTNNPYETL